MVALLGPAAHADLPVVKTAQASWQGCDYTIKVLQDVDEPMPRPLYRVSVQSAVVSPDTCSLVPTTVELGTSILEPTIAIAATAQGLVAAYSGGEYVKFGIGRWAVTHVHRLSPSTLRTLRLAELAAGWTSAPGTAGGPGTAEVDQITIYPSHVEVTGTRNGNLFGVYPSYSPYRFGEGTHFAAFYPGFFGPNQQQPVLFIY
ncbi:hypothetical protein JQX13_23105 [Archangium violaceum]|uniref:hypothetical protein n=1 Tax=Archangium violaceum TaxID=83451 RepID=UPI00193C7D77|nr:hypothetical protein [Archangium violaceum]QRK12666.1 hypothetical protein JQX13_23105 [Archangium violaceum]